MSRSNARGASDANGLLSKYANDAVDAVERNIRSLAMAMAMVEEASNTNEGRIAAKTLRRFAEQVRRKAYFQGGWEERKE